MQLNFRTLTITCVLGWGLSAITPAKSAEGPDVNPDLNVVGGPQLGSQPVEAEQPARAVPPAPAPGDSEPEPSPGPNAAPETAPQPTVHDPDLAAADGYLAQGRFDLAVQAASRALAQDPANAAAKSIRAEAYKQMGRFEEALADQRPLEMVVTAPQAEIKTGRTVLAIVPGGTKLLIDDVRGNWLKVIAAGDRQFDWAWIHKANWASAPPSGVGVAIQGGDVSISGGISLPGEELRLDINGRVDRPLGPGGYYYADPYARYYYADPRWHAYGRRSYDWWQHVPPQYWGYLPR